MAPIGDDLSISGADQLEEKSCVKRWISRVALVISTVLRLFFFSVALLPVTVLCVKQTAIFVLSKFAASGVLDAWRGWISLPCVMFVVLNIVIVTLGIKSGVFSSVASNESMWTPFIEVRFDQTAKIEACCLTYYPQEECHLNLDPTMEIESSNSVLRETLQNLKRTTPSLHSMRNLLSEAEQENFVTNSDTEMFESFSADCRALNSSISIPTVNEKSEDSLTSSPSSIFVEVSRGKAEVDVQFEYDGPKHDENWKADDLFLKCEDFIEEFKRQLRLQRQNSWKRLHKIYTESC